MNIGDLVWNNYHNVLRFGTIQSKRVDQSGWAYYKKSTGTLMKLMKKLWTFDKD